MEQAVTSETEYIYQHASGEIVSVGSLEEAIGGCVVLGDMSPDEARLFFKLHAIGAEKIAEEAEEEPEESEFEEAAEEQPEQKTEAKKSEKNTGSDERERPVVPEKEPQLAQQSGASVRTKPEVAQFANLPVEVETAKDSSSRGAGSLGAIYTATPLPERVEPVATAVSEVKESVRSVQEESREAGKATASGMEHGGSERPKIAAEETPTMPIPEIEASARQETREPEAEPVAAEIPLAAEVDEKPADLPFDRKLRIENSMIEDVEFQIPKHETEAGYIDAELEEILPENGRLIDELPVGEVWQAPEELIEGGIQQMEISEEIALPTEETASQNTEIAHELSVSVEEVEQTILQISERIEEMEDGEAEIVHELLDQIINKVAEIQVPAEGFVAENQGMASEASEKEKELKKLFVQLFDRVGIEYTPELIESCVKLALQGDILELVPESEPKDEEINVPHDRGTHEAIKQMLIAISNIKQLLVHVYHLGRSALRLYSQQLVVS